MIVKTKAKDPKRSEAARKGWATRKAAKEAKSAEIKESVGAASITKFFPDKGMAQIYDSGLEFAFVSPEGEQCHPFAYCKDFLQDAIWSMHNDKKSSVYGFSFDKKSNPLLDMDRTKVAIRLKNNKSFKDMCLKSLQFLNAVEEAFGFESTSLSYGGDSKGSDVWVFSGDKNWMYAPPMISMYTLLLRVGLNYDGGDWQKHLDKASFVGDNDKVYLKDAKPAIKFLSTKKLQDVFASEWKDNYPKDCEIMGMHHYSGIQCLGRGNISSSVNKNWKLKSIK
jgi:hypothetical protein